MTYAIRDSMTMLRRNLRRSLRYPVAPATTMGIPIVLLLLFVFVFGNTLGAGLPGASGGRGDYLDYVTPGILLLAITGAAQSTAIAVAMDMTEGIVARFRTMAIARASVLTGHVVGSLIQTLLGLAVVTGVALALGFDATATPLEWLGAIGLLALVTFAVTWLAVALGPGHQERRGGEQPADAADPAAVPRQRLRPHRVDAARAAVVRREPALHADHGDPARAAARHPDREQRVARDRVVAGHRAGVLRVGQAPLRPLR